MALADIFNVPAEIEIDGKKYKAEYDFNGYATLETLTGKGLFNLYNLLMVQNNLTLNDSIEVICCSLLKHHKSEEITQVREYLQKNIHAIQDLNVAIIGAFTAPMIAPEILAQVDDAKKKLAETEEQQATNSIG